MEENNKSKVCFYNYRAFNLKFNDCMATTIENKSTSTGQEEEINSLRDYFKDNIRILSSIGQFSYIY